MEVLWKSLSRCRANFVVRLSVTWVLFLCLTVRHCRRIRPIIWSATQDRGQFYGKDLLREFSIKDVRKSRKGIAAERLKGLFHHARRNNGSVSRDNNRWSAGLSQFHMRALSAGR